MAANSQLHRVNEWAGLRGFANLYRKEHRAWWGTRRWWFNALLWTALLCGLLAIPLFMPVEMVTGATEAEIAQSGGLNAYVVMLGLGVFFEFGVLAVGVGVVLLAHDLIIGEKQDGVAEWLLSRPVTRRAFVLAKLAANALGMSAVLVGLPSVVAYGMVSARFGTLYPLPSFLSAVGIMTAHGLFYLTLTLMLGTVFNNRVPILGIALGSVLGGNILGGFIKPLFYITPWMLPKVASLTAAGQAMPAAIGTAPLVFSVLWSVAFIFVALAKFEKTEW